MTHRLRTLGALAALALTIAACGGSAEPDRFSLTTPKAPETAPEPVRAPVTAAERRVVQGWSDELRHGDVKAAAKYFSVPSEAVNLPGEALRSPRDIERFNDSFPCGAKLVSGVERTGGRLVVADFEFVRRPGAICESIGAVATFAFLIDAQDHISRLILVVDKDAPIPGADDVASA